MTIPFRRIINVYKMTGLIIFLLVLFFCPAPESYVFAAVNAGPESGLDFNPDIMNDEDARADELLVLVTKGTKLGEIRDMAEDAGTTVAKVKTLGDGTRMVKFQTDPEEVQVAVGSLQEEDKVLLVQPNYLYKLEKMISYGETVSSITDKQWHLWSAYKYAEDIAAGGVDVVRAWEQLTASGTSSRTIVAVIDTGVMLDHHDLRDQILKSKCVTINRGKVYTDFTALDGSDDDNGHGTHVCGIIAASGCIHTGSAGSSTGASGIAKGRSQIICIDAEDPETGSFSTEDVCLSIDYAVRNKARVINLSIGGLYRDLVMESYISDAWDNGTLCVCAAGNDAASGFNSPGDSPHAISVMSHDIKGDKSYFSNYGKEKDVSAPGQEILSTVTTPEGSSGYHYQSKSGTSMASPVVAGLAALLLSEKPSLTVRQLKNLIYTSGAASGEPSFSAAVSGFGFGRVNAFHALTNLKADAAQPGQLILNKTSITVSEGDSTSVEFAVFPGTAGAFSDHVHFTSDNPQVASVDKDGIITGKKAGKTTVTVQCENLSKEVPVTVKGMTYTRIPSLPYSTMDTVNSEDYAVRVCDGTFDQWGSYMKGYELNIPANKTIDITLNTYSTTPRMYITGQDGTIYKSIISDKSHTVSFSFTAAKTAIYQIRILHVPSGSKSEITTYSLDIKAPASAAAADPDIVANSSSTAASPGSGYSGGSDRGKDNNTVAPKTETRIRRIKIKGISKKIAAGKKIRLTATVYPGNAPRQKLRWTSSNNKIATVSRTGLVKINKKAGGKSVVITASATDGSGKKAAWSVRVMKQAVKAISIDKVSYSVLSGRTLRLRTRVIASKAANKTLLWTSGNPKWATVKNGVVKTYKAGKGKQIKITARTTDGSNIKKTVTVQIK